MSNTLNFSSDKRLSSQFLIFHTLSKKGQASIFNLMPPLPPQQPPNKQYLNIIVRNFVMEGSSLNHKQYSPTASQILSRGEEIIKWNALLIWQQEPKWNISVCRRQRSVNTKYITEPLWLQTDTCHFYFFVLSKIADAILSTSKPKIFLKEWKQDGE